MTLGQLRTFVEVARAGSIRGAAAALVVTEPSVSAGVTALQREMGVDLLEREGRGIRLTAAGRELARYGAEILGLADRATRAVREAGGDAGHLRIVAATTAGEYVLPPILAAFLQKHPGMEVSLEVGNRANTLEHLMSQEADLAVGGRPPPGGEVGGHPFLPNRLIVVASTGHRLRSRRAVTPTELSGERWLIREEGSGTRETTQEFLTEAGVTPRSMLDIGSNGAIKRAAAVGLGITLMSMDAVRTELATKELVRLRVTGTPLIRSWHVLYRKSTALPRSAQALLDLLGSPSELRKITS